MSFLKEDQVIQLLKDRFKAPQGYLGIGDDCAAFPRKSGGCWLVTTDSMVEGTHFIRQKISMEDLGYKLAMVNFSDIAAMGGTPHSLYLSLALPQDFTSHQSLIDGIEEACGEAGSLLLGGDIVRSSGPLFLSVTVIGEVVNPITRGGGKAGDTLFVTGHLGDSAAGLEQLLKGTQGALLSKHLRPRAHIQEGRALSGMKGLHALMDISDGLHIDVQRLIQASGCGAQIFLEKLPISKELADYAGERAEELAVSGGEDYCLLAAIDPGSSADADFLFPIGKLTEETGKLSYLLHGSPIKIDVHPFEHFA